MAKHERGFNIKIPAQAKNEQDGYAIPALKRALSLDPSNQEAVMALAACYTNESYQAQACRALQDWIKRHNNYESKGGGPFNLSVLDEGFTSSFMTQELHRETTDLFIRAARMNNSSEYTEHRRVTKYESQPFLNQQS